MHVGLFAPGWPYGSVSNGILTYVHWLREGLLAQGHKVSIFVFSSEGAVLEPDVHPVRPSRAIVARRWLLRKLGRSQSPEELAGENILSAALRLHRRQPLSVFEMEESFGWVATLIEADRFPVVVKLHGPAFLSLTAEELGSASADAKIEREGRALSAAIAITSPSLCTLTDTISRYGLAPRLKAHIVNPLGLPPSAPRWSLATCDKDTLLFVGRFDKRKGADRVLRAFKIARAQRPWLKLVMAGPDAGLITAEGTKVHFEAAAAEHFTASERASLTFLGPQRPEEVARLRATAAVTLVASRWESQGYTALEAMLQGCPVVCADTSGLREAVRDGHNGLLFDGDDPDDLVSKIFAILDSPELAIRLGAQARRDVAEIHGLGRIVAQTLAVYESVAAVTTRDADARHGVGAANA